MKKKLVITGGVGFIGTNLALDASNKGYQVVVFDNLSRRGTDLNLQYLSANANIVFVEGDICSSEEVDRLVCENYDAEAFFHFAGQVAVTTSVQNPRADFLTNAMGSINLLEALRSNNYTGLVLYASTNKVYGGLEEIETHESETRHSFVDYPLGISEQFPLEFHSPYGCSKGAADQYFIDYARMYGLKTVVYRQSCIYGEHQFGIEDQGWVAWFTIAAVFDKEVTIYGDGKQVRDVLYIGDLVDAYWKALQRKDIVAGEVFNIGGGKYQMSLSELIRHLNRVLGKEIQISYQDVRPGDQKVYVSDVRKAEQYLDWTPITNVENGVEGLAKWAIENRELFRQAGVI